jgi:TadE-like protein
MSMRIRSARSVKIFRQPRAIFFAASRMHRSLCEQRGQSIAEFAMVLPLLLLLLVGTIEIGRFAYYGIEVQSAARAAVQYGVQSLAASKDTAGLQQAAHNDAPDITNLQVNPSNTCACSDSPGTFVGCPLKSTDCPAGHPVVFVQVDTSADISPLFNYPGISSKFKATGRAIMRVAQ